MPNRPTIDLELPGSPADMRVVVAMSGGVDSSVAAALCAHAGYDVVGVTLQLYDHGAATRRKGACCAGEDIHDARRVAHALGVPHYVLDYEARFRTAVIDDFADGYAAGETPLPCVRCNQRVKFADLMALSRDLGAAALVTGHYIASRANPAGRALHRAADPERDQSYFLFTTTREQLDYLRFPLGDLPKAQTRAIAADLGLAVADKPDSQDICFVPQGHYSDIVRRLRPDAAIPGEIVHVDGRMLGTHEGVFRFTVGQRRGLGIATGEPLFVVRIDADTHSVVVGPRTALETRRIALKEINWLGGGSLASAAGRPLDVAVKVRSTRPAAPALLVLEPDGTGSVRLAAAEHGVARGQACVFYEDDGPRARVLGGGWISEADPAAATGHVLIGEGAGSPVGVAAE